MGIKNNASLSCGIILQARRGSTRLPNKIFMPFYKDMGILEILVRRISERIDLPLIIATTNLEIDDKVEHLANKLQVKCYRGSETNVLKRFIGAADQSRLSDIVRICADNPFLDIDSLIQLSQVESSQDYTYFSINSRPSITTHLGFWAEKVKYKALCKIEETTREELYLEHVTNYIYSHPEDFSINELIPDVNIDLLKNVRLTLDTASDFKILQYLFTELHPTGKERHDLNSILDYIESHPEIRIGMKKNIDNNAK